MTSAVTASDGAQGSRLELAVFSEVVGNPAIQHVAPETEAYRDHRADGLVAVGGGSSMDVAKAVDGKRGNALGRNHRPRASLKNLGGRVPWEKVLRSAMVVRLIPTRASWRKATSPAPWRGRVGARRSAWPGPLGRCGRRGSGHRPCGARSRHPRPSEGPSSGTRGHIASVTRPRSLRAPRDTAERPSTRPRTCTRIG